MRTPTRTRLGMRGLLDRSEGSCDADTYCARLHYAEILNLEISLIMHRPRKRPLGCSLWTLYAAIDWYAY